MSLPEVHLVAGSCAEAVRLAPVVRAMRDQRRLTPILVAAGADPDRVGRTLAAFGVIPGITMPTGDGETEAIRRFDELWAARTPSAVILRDDLAAALAAFWRRIPIMQIDAGRRAADLAVAGAGEPNRRLLTQVTTVHLAATPLTAMNLLDERVVAGDVLLTGSTVPDALRVLRDRRRRPRSARLVLVGVDAEQSGPVGAALRTLGDEFADMALVVANRMLTYPERMRLLNTAYLVVTDSADLAEEAAAAGVPALPPGETVADQVAALLRDRAQRDALVAGEIPAGDGNAAERVAQATAAILGHGQFPEPMPLAALS